MRCSHLLSGLVIISICALFSVPPASCQGLSEEELQDLYSQAKQLFREGNEMAVRDRKAAVELYQRSVMRLERIVREGGVRNGKLYYNIGNTYFRMGRLGKAILNYRRAERYLPNDPNLHQNLEYARSRRLDKIEEKEKTKVLKTLVFWHYDLSLRTRSVVFLICFVGLWVGASIRLFLRAACPRWLLLCLGVISALFLSSLLYENVVQGREKPGVIVADEVVTRKGDGESYEPAFKEPLHSGTEFRVIEDRGEWYQIELRDGTRCWLPVKTVELLW